MSGSAVTIETPPSLADEAGAAWLSLIEDTLCEAKLSSTWSRSVYVCPRAKAFDATVCAFGLCQHSLGSWCHVLGGMAAFTGADG